MYVFQKVSFNNIFNFVVRSVSADIMPQSIFLFGLSRKLPHGYDNEMIFSTIQIGCIEQLSLVEIRNKTNKLRTTNTSAERPFVAPGATNQQQSLVDSFAFHQRKNNLASISFAHPADLCLG